MEISLITHEACILPAQSKKRKQLLNMGKSGELLLGKAALKGNVAGVVAMGISGDVGRY